MAIIHIFKTVLLDDPPAFSKFLNHLSSDQKRAVLRFVHPIDQLRSLAGKLLIRYALIHFGLSDRLFFSIKKGQNGRPFVEGLMDFNISHSGSQVICAASNCTKVGIDIEKIRPVNFQKFQDFFNPSEWKQIQQSQNQILKFFRFWVQKESVLKADGRGLLFPLNKIELGNKYADVEGTRWFLYDLKSCDNHIASLACTTPYANLVEHHIPFEDLLVS